MDPKSCTSFEKFQRVNCWIVTRTFLDWAKNFWECDVRNPSLWEFSGVYSLDDSSGWIVPLVASHPKSVQDVCVDEYLRHQSIS